MDTIIDLLFANQSLLLAVMVCSFLAGALAVYHLMPDEKRSAAQKMLGVVDESARENKILLLKLFNPINSLFGKPFKSVKSQWISDYKKKRRNDIIAGGLTREITPEEFIGFKFSMMFVLPMLAEYTGTVLGQDLANHWMAAIAIVGFFGPDLWLIEMIKQRKKEIFKALPYTMDLLTLSVEAGLDFIAAIDRLAKTAKPNALLDELKVLLNEISLGSSRADALRNFAYRVQMDEINSFTTLLIQADQLGANIGPVLRAQSDSLRTSRFQKAEIAGAKASQMVLFPMIFCIFPALFIILLGPLIVRFISQGLTGMF